MAAWLAGLAAAAALAAAVVQNRARKAEREHPPKGRFVEAGGVRLHYVERGEGEPLVLLHGNTLTGLEFLLSGLVEQAARRYRVIVFDRPGYGHSERLAGRFSVEPEAQARVIAAALAQLGAERAIVLGHSWASLVAVALALDHPQAVRGLVLESGYYFPTARPDVVIASPPAIPVIGDLLRYTVSPLMLRAAWPAVLKAIFAPAPVPARFGQFPPWLAARPWQLRTIAEEAAQLLPAARRLGGRYGELDAPAVILAGAGDKVVDPETHSGRLAAELSGADYRVREGAGHMIHHTDPAWVLDAIDAAAEGAPSSPMQSIGDTAGHRGIGGIGVP